MELSHEFQEFLDENPAIASGLATIGGVVVNAVLQSKYGSAISNLMKPPGEGAAAGGAATADGGKAAPRPRPAKPAARKPKSKATKAKAKAAGAGAKSKPAAKKKARRAPRAAK
jgi:hypothetical protein